MCAKRHVFYWSVFPFGGAAYPSASLRMALPPLPGQHRVPVDDAPLLGLGSRGQLERLMTQYKVRIPVPKKQEQIAHHVEDDGNEASDDVKDIEAENEMRDAIRKRMINVSRIEHIAMKNPWERRPDEVETVRKEIAKMEVFRKIDVSPAAERDICKFVRLRVYRPGDYIIRQGDVGDAFYIILEGLCTVMHEQMGVINQLFASDSFGEVALLEEGAVRQASVLSEQFAKCLEISKKEYNRYIKPFHKEEQAKRDALLDQLPVFSSLSKEQAHNLMGGMRTLRYRIGDKIITEGKYNHWLMFLVKGHVQVTKRVQSVKLDNSSDLPNPLEGYKDAKKRESQKEDVIVDLGILYLGSVIDPESVLSRQKSAFTATAMTQVQVLAVDTITHIFIDNPVIDAETLAEIRRSNAVMSDKSKLKQMAKDQVKWREYRDHLTSHVVYKHRKDINVKSGAFAKRQFNTPKNDLPFQGNLENPPELNQRNIADMVEPTDGRWPYSQPNIYRSEQVQKLMAMAPTVIMLKDKTMF